MLYSATETMIEAESVYSDVEDIMCDQGIITAEWNVDVDIQTSSSCRTISIAKVRVIFAVIAEVIAPPAEACYTYLRNQRIILESIRRQLVPTVFAYIANSISRSLSSVQRNIRYPLTFRSAITFPSPNEETCFATPEKSVECQVLSSPPNGEDILTDVVFIHGLHGSLRNTWRQGRWNSKRELKISMERSKSLGELENIKSDIRIPMKRSESAFESTFGADISAVETNTMLNSSQDLVEQDEEFICDGSYSTCWPKDWLPKDCPGVRVIALNYTTDPYLWRPIWMKKRNRSSLHQRSLEMIEHLLKLDIGKRPIVWVGHSKGGLFIKQIIIDTYEKEELRSLYHSTKGIMFYSVPHRGSFLANVNVPLTNRSIEVMEIRKDCSFLINLHKKFLDILETGSLCPEIYSFIEMSLTLMSFLYLRIVTPESADPGIGHTWGVPLDHREICKPTSRKCFLYRELVQLINKSAQNKYKEVDSCKDHLDVYLTGI